MNTPHPERRASRRIPDSGAVTVSFEDPVSVTVDAQLLETSATGFSIAHESKQLVPGLEIRLHRNSLNKRARVIWTHLLDGRRVSGCLLL